MNTSTPPAARRPPPKQSFLSNFFGGRKELDDLEDEEESNPHKGVQNEDPYSYTYSQPNAKNATPAPEPEPVVVQQQPVYQEQYDNSHQYNTLGNIPQITVDIDMWYIPSQWAGRRSLRISHDLLSSVVFFFCTVLTMSANPCSFLFVIMTLGLQLLSKCCHWSWEERKWYH